jgi:hypothetical protein
MNKLLSRCGGSGLTDCEGALRVAAATLRRATSGDITATTVMCETADTDVGAVHALVGDIAREYGLDASIRQLAACWSVRFSQPQPTLSPSRSVLHFWRRL